MTPVTNETSAAEPMMPAITLRCGAERIGHRQEPVAPRSGEPVLAEHVGLPQPQQQSRGGQRGDRQHQRAANALKLSEAGDAALLA